MRRTQKEKIIGTELKRSKANRNDVRGITLVALVITIVILIILATITINAAFGDGGLLEKAQSSKNMAEDAVEKEYNKMNSLLDEYSNIMAEDSNIPTEPNTNTTEEPNTNTVEEPEPEPETPTVDDVKDSGETFDKKTTIEDEKGNKIVVPGGFKIADDSGDTVQQGIVIEDVYASNDNNVKGSQYVWIPTGKFIKDNGKESNEIILGRYTFGERTGTPKLIQSADNADYIYNVPIKFENDYYNSNGTYVEELYYRQGISDDQNGENATAYNLTEWINSVKTNGGFYIGRYEASYAGMYKTASKKSKSVWNYISQIEASSIAINTYKQSNSVRSDLMNSYAWDTAIVYIQEAGHNNYAYKTDYLIDYVVDTGRTGDEVCKINDLAANTDEWTTESCTFYDANYNFPCVSRIASFRGSLTTVDGSYTTGISEYTSFRITLYIL